MNDKIYAVQISSDGHYVTMPIRDFVHLAGELGNFGVDVEISKDTTPGEIVFRLKETTREQ